MSDINKTRAFAIKMRQRSVTNRDPFYNTVANMRVHEFVDEANRIQEKKSLFSKSQRETILKIAADMVENKELNQKTDGTFYIPSGLIIVP